MLKWEQSQSTDAHFQSLRHHKMEVIVVGTVYYEYNLELKSSHSGFSGDTYSGPPLRLIINVDLIVLKLFINMLTNSFLFLQNQYKKGITMNQFKTRINRLILDNILIKFGIILNFRLNKHSKAIKNL